MTHPHVGNARQLHRLAESEASGRILKALLQRGRSARLLQTFLLARWKELDWSGRLVRRQINQMLSHFGRIEFAAGASLIRRSEAAIVADQGLLFLKNPEVEAYLAASNRSHARNQLMSRLTVLGEASPSWVDVRDFCSPHMIAAVISFDEALRKSRSIHRLATHVEEALLSGRDSDLEAIARTAVRQCGTQLRITVTATADRDELPNLAAGALDLIPLLAELAELLKDGDEWNLRAMLVDHYGYWITFLGPHLCTILTQVGESLSSDAAAVAEVTGLDQPSIHETCHQVTYLAQKTLMAQGVLLAHRYEGA